MPSWNDGQSMSSGRRSGPYDMTIETWRASSSLTVAGLFAVFADSVTHPGIDGTGWVGKALDTTPLTRSGRMFRIAM